MTTEFELNKKKLIKKIREAKDTQVKTELWQKADLSKEEYTSLVRDMVLSMPKGYYKIHSREYGTNLVDAVYNTYGWMPSMYVNESLMLGLQALNPDKVYASFTHNLDAIEIKGNKTNPKTSVPNDPRSSRSEAIDRSRTAKKVTHNYDEWAKKRNRIDLSGVDTRRSSVFPLTKRSGRLD